MGKKRWPQLTPVLHRWLPHKLGSSVSRPEGAHTSGATRWDVPVLNCAPSPQHTGVGQCPKAHLRHPKPSPSTSKRGEGAAAILCSITRLPAQLGGFYTPFLRHRSFSKRGVVKKGPRGCPAPCLEAKQGHAPITAGAPMPSQALEADQDLQLWKEIDDACSTYLSTDSQPQVSSALEELCFLVMGFLEKPQGLDEKDNTKRFLFHYSKTHDSGNSDIMSSVLHPLLQLVPQLNERRLKRHKVDVIWRKKMSRKRKRQY
ncbi:neuromedin-U isoform X2 [Cygnus olor]|uniref:neuromedin-U isoform X2 n=1 Tax=Cygnus olor TaxID=8869 RepID=UPI001ADEB159|nr:neuromedin-U isoform X2 [Cygnus olor]